MLIGGSVVTCWSHSINDVVNVDQSKHISAVNQRHMMMETSLCRQYQRVRF